MAEKNGSDLMNWVEKKLAPKLNKFGNFRLVRTITAGFWFAMPMILVGVVFQILGNIGMAAFMQSNPELMNKILVLKDLSYGLMGIIFVIGIAQADAKENNIEATAPIIFGIITFFILLKPSFIATDNIMVKLFQVDFNRFGASNMMLAIIAGLGAAEVCAFFDRRNWAPKLVGVPQFMQSWFSSFYSGIVLLGVSWIIVYLFDIDLVEVINSIFASLIGVNDTLLALIILGLLGAVAFSVGIHPLAVLGVTMPLMMKLAGDNAALYDAGVKPLISNGYHFNSIGTLLVFVMVGGTGATLGLNLLMLRSKVPVIKQLGKTAIVPSFLNINEPLIFGCPIVFNPPLALGMILIQGIINPVFAYIVTMTNLVPPASSMMVIPFIPTPFLALIMNMGVAGFIAALAVYVIDTIAWYPFFKVYEKQW